MIRILVAEDEEASRRHLVRLLAEQPGTDLVGEASSGPEALRMAVELRPDALFLDIEMPGFRGTELLHLLPEPRPALVFVTAYPEHALEAFAGGAVHYLLKPIGRLGVAQALTRIQPKDAPIQRELLRLPVRRKGLTRLLRPEEVEALLADLGDSLAWTVEGPLPVEGPLSHWEGRLAGSGFARIHRGALVRLDAVKAITDGDELVLAGGRIQVSKRRADEVRRSLGL
jgi:two-component system, LytTR family, response regulator